MQGVVLVVLACHIGRADEGMWLFNAVPEEQLSRDMAFVPSRAWLDHIQRSAVRFNSGGSGAFVSPDGLVLTNHHVAASSLQKLSTPEKILRAMAISRGRTRRKYVVLISSSMCFVLSKMLRLVWKKPLRVPEVHRMHW
jgi:S1-C subfamily serine protease